ncbi:Holliday junction resolvase RuvX [Dermacoccaceae bacterium W4C1]
MRRGVRLGVDVGTARVGLASSDPDGLIATPVATLARSGETDLAEVVREVGEREVIEVVVGLPLTLSGGSTASTEDARGWAKRLAARCPGLSVRLVDERLSTVDAHRVLRESGLDTRQHRSRVDQQAAVAILQVALDYERGTGKPAGESVGGRKPRTKARRTASTSTTDGSAAPRRSGSAQEGQG